MRKFTKIFLTYSQVMLTERSRSFVWFLHSLIPPIILYVYWLGALQGSGGNIEGWTLSTISSYYFLLIIASTTLLAHIEEAVAYTDIQQGEIVKYIVKPYPYFLTNLVYETPYRIVQGGYGIIAVLIFVYFFGEFFTFSSNPITIFLAIVISLLAFMLSFTFKMVLGLLAFWLTDTRGLYEITTAVIIVFAGFLLPITLLPWGLSTVAQVLPFAYMIYYPIISFQEELTYLQMVHVVLYQLLWIFIFGITYRFVWKKGVKKISGVGL